MFCNRISLLCHFIHPVHLQLECHICHKQFKILGFSALMSSIYFCSMSNVMYRLTRQVHKSITCFFYTTFPYYSLVYSLYKLLNVLCLHYISILFACLQSVQTAKRTVSALHFHNIRLFIVCTQFTCFIVCFTEQHCFLNRRRGSGGAGRAMARPLFLARRCQPWWRHLRHYIMWPDHFKCRAAAPAQLSTSVHDFFSYAQKTRNACDLDISQFNIRILNDVNCLLLNVSVTLEISNNFVQRRFNFAKSPLTNMQAIIANII